MKKIFFSMLAISMFLFSLVISLNAFSIVNKTDINIYVEENNGFIKIEKGFSAKLGPGEEAHCSWKDPKCNKSRNKDAIFRFNVSKLDTKFKGMICKNFKIRANNTLMVSGKNGKYQCLLFEPIIMPGLMKTKTHN